MDLLWILIITFTFLVIYWFLTKNYNYWKEQNVPFLQNPVPGFGNIFPLITLRDSMWGFVNSTYNSTTASMIGFYFMRRPGLMVRDPELVKCILQTNFTNFRLNLTSVDEKQDPILSKHPFFTSDVNTWKERRLHISNNLSGKKLQHLFVIAESVCFKMSEYLDRKIDEYGGLYECELKSISVRYTGEFVANSALGIEGQSFRDNPDKVSFAEIAKDLFKVTFLNGLKQWVIFYLPDFAKFFRMNLMPGYTSKYFHENVKAIIKKRKQQKEILNDFLQFTIDNVGENNLDTLISDIVSFYGDTYETASSVLSHFCYHISLHPEIQEKLRQHIVSKLNGNPATYESLKLMTYLDQVLYESMRLTAPEIALMKICTEEITLTGFDGLKCCVKPGSPIFVPMMNIHQDEKYWPNSKIFDPERFNPESQDPNLKLAFFPFSEGPRMCIGMRLGIMLIKLAVTTILTKCSLEPSSKTKVPLEIEPNSILTLYKGGVWAKFKKLDISH